MKLSFYCEPSILLTFCLILTALVRVQCARITCFPIEWLVTSLFKGDLGLVNSNLIDRVQGRVRFDTREYLWYVHTRVHMYVTQITRVDNSRKST